MKRSMAFLIGQALIVFTMILLIDFTYMTKFMLALLWGSWSCIVAICYAILTREEIDCKCFEVKEE